MPTPDTTPTRRPAGTKPTTSVPHQDEVADNLPLLERDEPLALLRQVLADVRAGQGRCVVIRAAAGVGKTRLVDTLAAETEADGRRTGARLRWLQAGCDALQTPRPLGPLVDLAPALPSFLADALHAAHTYNGLFPSLLAWLSRDTPPAVLVIEDLHWADEATLDGVRYLGRRIAGAGFALVLTLRPEEADDPGPLHQTLAALDARATVHIELQPLSEQAVAQAAAARGRGAERLYALTAGNPFFLQQVLGVPAGQVPGSLRDAVLADAGALAPPARAALDTLCLAPGGLPLDMLLRLHPEAASGLERAPARRLVRLRPPLVQLQHELARQVLEDALPPLTRWQNHRRLFDALSEPPDRPGRATRLVHHAAAAGLSEDVARLAPVAAEEAIVVGAHRSAIRAFELALAHGEAAPPLQRAGWLRRLSQCHHAVQARDASRKALRQAIDLLRAEGERAAAAACRAQLALQLTPEPEALALAEQAVADLADGPATADQALAHAALAITLANLGRTAEALIQARKAESCADASGDAEARLHAGTIAASVALSLAPSPQAFERLQRCVDDAIAQRRSDRVGVPLINLVSVSLVHAEYDRVLAATARGIAYCAERDMDLVRAHLHVRRALALLELARWDDARATLAELLAMPSPPPHQAASARILVARLDALQGRGENTAASWKVHVETAQSGRTDLIPAYVATAAAEAAWLRGDLDATRTLARDALGQSEGPWLVGALRQWLRRCGEPLAPTRTPLTPAHQAAEAGDAAQAHRLWQARGCHFEAALALADGDEAQRRQALAELQGLGAAPAADVTRRQLQADGARGLVRGPYGHARHDPLGLTRRERQVAEALAEGLSNAEIAQRMHRSPRTIGHHVSAVLAKLGLASRAQVASALASESRRREASSPTTPQAINSSEEGSGTGGSAP